MAAPFPPPGAGSGSAADLSSLDFGNPIDGSGTQLVAARDDTGRGLLAAHDAVDARWMVADGVHYQGYLAVSPDAPVIAVAVVGGDASDEANGMGMGLERGMFVIKGDPPPTVGLEVTYAPRETREFPFKLSFGVGF